MYIYIQIFAYLYMSILSYCILYDLYGNSRISQAVREKRVFRFFLAERDQPSFQKC